LTVNIIVFPPQISFSSQFHLDIVALLLKYQREISEDVFKLVLSLFIPIMIIRTPQIGESYIHVPFNFIFITINMYEFITKVKLHEINSVHKDQSLPKNLSGSNWTQIRIKMWPEMLSFYCRNSTGTKYGLVEVRSAA